MKKTTRSHNEAFVALADPVLQAEALRRYWATAPKLPRLEFAPKEIPGYL